jgi:radical SAM superfamily enzyme YgiQ (UPF0313 family)
MRLYLINPRNVTVSAFSLKDNPLNKYRLFKPLGLLILARLTPSEWEVTVFDESRFQPDYTSMPRPDLVGLTAFTSQAERAYAVAAEFRARGVPVVMGGIHATMCSDEALERVDAVVTGEAEEIWADVLEDARQGTLKRVYKGSFVDIEKVPMARHDLLSSGYAIGSIQTTRGCPLNCSFCSVTAFNGSRFRQRPIDHVVEEFRLIKEKRVLIVDDNLIGTTKAHLARSKELFRAMINAKIRKKWMAQVTINMAEDEELLRLAARAGCFGVLIGVESLTDEGLTELNKKFNMRIAGDLKAACRRIQRHGIGVQPSFIIGLDADRKGVGREIVDVACSSGANLLAMQIMTPLPGTRLWETLESQGRIAADSFPEDWRYYTWNLPVARYRHLSWAEIIEEFTSGFRRFYSYPRIARRSLAMLLHSGKPIAGLSTLVANLMFRRNLRLERGVLERYDVSRGAAYAAKEASAPAAEVLPSRPGGVEKQSADDTDRGSRVSSA